MMTTTVRILAVLLMLGGFAFGQTTVPTTFLGMTTTSVYDWSRLDDWVQTAETHGVSIIYSNDGIPAWAVERTAISQCLPVMSGSSLLNCRARVANIQDWDNFVTALTTRYKSKLIYELWNEPSANGTYFTVDDMITLTNHEYNIIRGNAPGAKILCCGFAAYNSYVFMSKFFAAGGGPRGVDGIGFHGIFGIPVKPPESIVSQVDAVRQILGKYGLSGMPLWDTEGGWSIKSPPPTTEQPAFIAKWYLLQWFKGVSHSYWMAWSSWRPLWNPTTGINAAGIAYQQVYDWMVGATMSSPCALAKNGTTWTCGFTRSGSYQGLVIWNTSGGISYMPATQYKQYRTLSGRTVQITAGHSITIGQRPKLLENFTP